MNNKKVPGMTNLIDFVTKILFIPSGRSNNARIRYVDKKPRGIRISDKIKSGLMISKNAKHNLCLIFKNMLIPILFIE